LGWLIPEGISCNVHLQHVSAVIHFHGKFNLGTLKSFNEKVSDRAKRIGNKQNSLQLQEVFSLFCSLDGLRGIGLEHRLKRVGGRAQSID